MPQPTPDFLPLFQDLLSELSPAASAAEALHYDRWGRGGGRGGRRSHRSLRGSWGLLAGAHLEPTYTLKSRWDIGMNPRKMSSGVPRFGSYASKNREGGSKPKNAGKGVGRLVHFVGSAVHVSLLALCLQDFGIFRSEKSGEPEPSIARRAV